MAAGYATISGIGTAPVNSNSCSDVLAGFMDGMADRGWIGCSATTVTAGTSLYFTPQGGAGIWYSYVLSSITATPSTLLSDVSAQSAAINTLSGQYTTLNNTVTGLNSSLTTLQNQYSNLNTSSSAQAGQIAVINGQISGINTHLTSLDTSVAGLTTSVNGQASSIGSLSGQIGSVQGSLSSLGNTVASLQNTVASLGSSSGGSSSGGSSIDSPFYLSSTEGGLIAVAVLAVWVAAYAFKAAKRALDLSPE